MTVFFEAVPGFTHRCLSLMWSLWIRSERLIAWQASALLGFRNVLWHLAPFAVALLSGLRHRHPAFGLPAPRLQPRLLARRRAWYACRRAPIAHNILSWQWRGSRGSRMPGRRHRRGRGRINATAGESPMSHRPQPDPDTSSTQRSRPKVNRRVRNRRQGPRLTAGTPACESVCVQVGVVGVPFGLGCSSYSYGV